MSQLLAALPPYRCGHSTCRSERSDVAISCRQFRIRRKFCEIATAASGLAMTKSDIIDSLRIVLGKPNAIFVCLALWLAGSAGDVALLDQLVAGAVAVGAVAVLDALGRAAVRIVELSGVVFTT